MYNILILTIVTFLIRPAMAHGQHTSIQSEQLTFTLELVVDNLESPWGMEFLPNGDLLFSERSGKLYRFNPKTKAKIAIAGVPDVFTQGQGGLLDLKLHPQYAETGWIYFSYAVPAPEGGGNTALMRAKLQDDTLVSQQLLFKAQPDTQSGVHFGSRIEFDNQGLLFFSVGDRGEWDNAQRLTNHSGKIHRLTDDGKIPPDNPFVNMVGAMPSIWSYGHRNPQGLVLQPKTGTLWEHEHGPKGGDEVNIIQKGKNYGWPSITYGINYNGATISKLTAQAGMEQPVIYWTPSIAPSGLAFVTSSKYPGWENNLLVGSLRFQYLHRCVVRDGKIVKQEKLLDRIGRVRCIKQAPDGYLYFSVEGDGKIYKIVPL